MAIFIENIKLTNWFNFKGEPDEKTGKNTIDFNEGLNIIVGDNNGGKTKLHNALRYIVSDKVILDLKNKVQLCNVSGNELEILNKDTFLKLSNNDNVKFGVELTFSKNRSDGTSKKYVLKKYIEGRKEPSSNGIDKFHALNEISIGFVVDPITNSLLEKVGEFEKIKNQLLTPAYMNFFLVEGEQIGLITTMQGDNLQKTINVINPSLNAYAKTFDTVNSVKDSVERLAKKELKAIAEGDIEKTLLTDKLLALSNIEIPNYIESIKKLDEQNNEWLQTIDKYEIKAQQSEARIKTFKALSDLYTKRNNLMRDRENKESNYINSLINNSFNISKLTNDNVEVRKMDTISSQIKKCITQRKIELKPSQDENEIMMLESLDESQPDPTILRKMISDCMCYVCQTKIDSSSKDWIEKKLIPFFEEKNIDDLTLKNLIELKQLFRLLNSDNDRNKSLNKGPISALKQEIVNVVKDLKIAQGEVDEFVNNHGDISKDEEDSVNIHTYNRSKEENLKNRITHDRVTVELNKSKNLVKEYTKIIQGESGNNPKLEKIQLLVDLLNDLDKVFKNKKREIFESFATRLEGSATLRFRKFLSRNNVARNQKVSVSLMESGDDYQFKINVLNQFGSTQSQSGGAQDSLTKLAVVFALLDISKEVNVLGFPFMADAPTSKLSKPQKESFYEQLFSDEALNQTLLMTMDLFDSKDNNDKNLNALGLKVLNDIGDHNDSSMVLLDLVNKNKPELGVQIKYLKK